MAQLSNRRPVVGAAINLGDLDRIDGLRDFIRDRDRDVEVQDLAMVDALRTDWSPIAERARKALDGHAGRIGIHGPYNGFALDVRDSDIRALAKDRLQAGLDACMAMAPDTATAHMVVHSPITTWDWYNNDDRPGTRERQIELVHDTLGHIVKRAEDAGVTIVIENIEDKDPRDWADLASSFGSPAIRASLDTGHAHYAHGATGGPPVDYFVRAAGDLLAHVHLQDADGFADRHWRLGEGSIHWPAVFRALDDLPEMPRLLLEMANPQDIMPSADFLIEHGLAL